MSVPLTPTQKKSWSNGAVAQFGDHQVRIIDTKPTESGKNYHRVQLIQDGTTLPLRISADELR